MRQMAANVGRLKQNRESHKRSAPPHPTAGVNTPKSHKRIHQIAIVTAMSAEDKKISDVAFGPKVPMSVAGTATIANSGTAKRLAKGAAMGNC